jgi:hypothetical protein
MIDGLYFAGSRIAASRVAGSLIRHGVNGHKPQFGCAAFTGAYDTSFEAIVPLASQPAPAHQPQNRIRSGRIVVW